MSDSPLSAPDSARADTVDGRALESPVILASVEAARRAYCDAGFPERPCDHCGELYKGPAVYCCLDCALAGA
jgi:hypothetical protein